MLVPPDVAKNLRVRTTIDELSPVKKVINRKSKKFGNLSLVNVSCPASRAMTTSTPTLQNCDVFRMTVGNNLSASSPLLQSGPRPTLGQPSASSPEFRSFEKSSPDVPEKSSIERELSRRTTNLKSFDLFDEDDVLKTTAGTISINDLSHPNKVSVDLFEENSKDDEFYKSKEVNFYILLFRNCQNYFKSQHFEIEFNLLFDLTAIKSFNN